jgi:hypothetical protein
MFKDICKDMPKKWFYLISNKSNRGQTGNLSIWNYGKKYASSYKS